MRPSNFSRYQRFELFLISDDRQDAEEVTYAHMDARLGTRVYEDPRCPFDPLFYRPVYSTYIQVPECTDCSC